jgi:hypothetical protein
MGSCSAIVVAERARERDPVHTAAALLGIPLVAVLPGSHVAAIRVVNVRRRKFKSVGRSLWELNPAWPPAARPDGPPSITGFVLSPLGSGAVTFSWSTPWTVAAFDPLREPNRFDTLDTGADPRGLRLISRTRVQWRQGGQARRATLPAPQ